MRLMPKYFEASSMKELHDSIRAWLRENTGSGGSTEEIHSLSIEKDDRGVFCCIALHKHE
jgi:hypothetical protein